MGCHSIQQKLGKKRGKKHTYFLNATLTRTLISPSVVLSGARNMTVTTVIARQVKYTRTPVEECLLRSIAADAAGGLDCALYDKTLSHVYFKYVTCPQLLYGPARAQLSRVACQAKTIQADFTCPAAPSLRFSCSKV